MIMQNINDIFTRQAIKERLMQSAAQSWGFEKYELEQFDPLVELLMGALAKEMEKSILFFNKRYEGVLQHTIRRLIPELSSFVCPAFSFIQVKAPINSAIVTPQNTKFTKEVIKGGVKNTIIFTPLQTYELTPSHVTCIAYDGKIYEFNNLEKTQLFNYQSSKNCLYIGLNISGYETNNREVQLYVDWPNNPSSPTYRRILEMAVWTNVELYKTNRSFSDIQYDVESEVSKKIKLDYYLREDLADIESTYNKNLIRFKLPEASIKKSNIFPEKLSIEASKKLEEIHKKYNIFWVEIKLPPHQGIKKMCEDIYCQTNCIPVVNYKKVRHSTKIKAPFKIVKLSGEGFFVKIDRIENLDGMVYHPKEIPLESSHANTVGTYQLHKNIGRIGKNVANREIGYFLDLIKEERNAFAAIEPDWLVDELKKLRILIKGIEKKIDYKSQINPEDVFVELENELSEDIIYIDYVTSQGKIANGIPLGEMLETNSNVLSSQPSMLLKTSIGGNDYVDGSINEDLLTGIIHGTDRIVTEADLKIFVHNVLKNYEVHSIEVKKQVTVSQDKNTGLIPIIWVYINLSDQSNMDREYLEMLLDQWLASRCLWGLEIKTQIYRS